MLKAYWPTNAAESTSITRTNSQPDPQQPIAVIGAGIAGLSCAYALAQRGYRVCLIDQSAPLAGASGNPRALLMPKLTPLSHVSEHLHTLGWLSTLRWWSVWQADAAVLEQTGGLSLSTDKNPIAFDKLADYPSSVTQAYQATAANDISQTPLGQPALWFPAAALLNPTELAKIVLAHPLITRQIGAVTALQPHPDGWQLQLHDADGAQIATVQQVIVCNAIDSRSLCPELPALNPIRGQLSWCPAPVGSPSVPLSYGGYCTQFVQDGQPLLLFGASFIRQDDQTDLRAEDHQHNAALLADVLPNLADRLPDQTTWHGRAAIRAQTRDYLPLVGAVSDQPNLWALAGLGAKGFAFAPLCAELLVAQMLGEVWPVPQRLSQKLRTSRPFKG